MPGELRRRHPNPNPNPHPNPHPNPNPNPNQVDHVMRECDLDGRGRLSFHEFKRVMDRFPDVEAKFSVQLQ